MLQFLRKTGRSKPTEKRNGSRSALTDPAGFVAAIPPELEKVDDVTTNDKPHNNDGEALCVAEQYCFARKEDSLPCISKLSRRMSDILAEQNCMCYFVQYMESKKALPLIKFWLDIESFKAAAFQSGEGPLKTADKLRYYTSERMPRSKSSDGYESLSYLSVDFDSLSTKSVSENGYEATSEDICGIDSHSVSSGPALPPTPALEESNMNETNQERANDGKQLMVNELKQLECCNMVILRQSLTDDEKTQIFGAGIGTCAEMCPPTKTKAMHTEDSICNSLINSYAVRIYRKYLSTNSPDYIDIPATMLSSISLTLCASGPCSKEIFNEVQLFLLDLLERRYLNQFLESSFYCRYTLEVLTSEKLTLKDILGSEMALFYFMEYLEQEGKQHYLEFYVAAVNFKRSFENKAEAQKDALVLYEKYFSLQASCPLGLSDKVRFLLEEQICSTDPLDIAECFELPVQIIEHFLEQAFFAGFIKSSLYCRLINELHGIVKTIANNNVSDILPGDRNCEQRELAQGKGHRKTLSDVSNDCSVGKFKKCISSQNTLLAMSDSNFQRNRKQLVTATIAVTNNSSSTSGISGSTGNCDMQIDFRQLYNPDLLWRRNSHAVGLTFGRVDSLGRYERDFDIMQPPSRDDRWNRNRIKKAVRKLVNLPEDKAQEELAWQVAEMIVKDITSVTMNKQT